MALEHIRNVEYLLEGFVDWSVMDGAFSNPKFRLGDADGLFELKGNLLIVEVKYTGATITTGQRIMYENLSKTKTAIIIVLWGKKDKVTGLHSFDKMMVYSGKEPKVRENITNEDVKKALGDWETFARKHPKV